MNKLKKIDDFLLENNILESIKEFFTKSKFYKPIIFYGSSGVGKSSLAQLILKEYDIYEINYDTYKKDFKKLERIGIRTVFGKSIAILVENFENYSYSEQFFVINFFKKRNAKNLVLILTNNELSQKIINKCNYFNLVVSKKKISNYIKNLFSQNNKIIKKNVLEFIYNNINNDIRQLSYFLQQIFFIYQNVKIIPYFDLKKKALLLLKDNISSDIIKDLEILLYNYNSIKNIYKYDCPTIMNTLNQLFLEEVIFNRKGIFKKKLVTIQQIYEYLSIYKCLRYYNCHTINLYDYRFVFKCVNILHFLNLLNKKKYISSYTIKKKNNYFIDFEKDDELYLQKLENKS